MNIIIPILLLIGIYAYTWFASHDVLKETKMFGGEKYTKIKWITFIPGVNMLFTLVITQIEMINEMSKMMEGYRTQMDTQMKQMKANGKGGK